jgi:lipopolysaccharide/colanic/teichoic acid biosynthesis glycosyltransferase
VDVDAYRPSPLPSGRKVFMYAGTHGLSQGLDVVLEAAKRVKRDDVEFLLVGDGAERAALVAKAERERIANVRFLPNQPKDSMPGLLAGAYATVITLKALDVFRRARPSKMYESMATGRPIVASLWGEAAELVEEARCGVVVEPENPDALASAIDALAGKPESARRLGENGRAYALEHFDRTKIARRLREVLLECTPPRRSGFERVLDVAVAAPALVVAAPVIAAAAIAIKADSPGPVFHHGLRVGRHGMPFRIHKLRTMRPEAETMGPAVTAGDDPRITRVGRFLRRTKLDELPQLLNVLKGEMSLVGPRPEHPDYVARYTGEQRRLLSVRPGVTGPATLAYIDEERALAGGAAESTYVRSVLPRKLELELRYLERATMRERLAILVRTAAALVRRPFASASDSSARSRSQPG